MAKRWGGFVDDDYDYDYETGERDEEEDLWKNWDGMVCHHSGMDGNHGKEMEKDNGNNEEGEGLNTMNVDLETKKEKKKKNDTPGRRWGRVWGLKKKGGDGDGNGNHGV